MNSQLAIEIVASLSVQISIIVAATFALRRWVGDARSGCRLWTVCFLAIIGLLAAAVLMPHRRLFDFPIGLNTESLLELVNWQNRLAIGMLIIWSIVVGTLLMKRIWLYGKLSSFLECQCTEVDSATVFSRLAWGEHETSASEGALDYSKSKSTANALLPVGLTIKVSREIVGPFCWQLHQPVIVLPAFLIEGDDSTMRNVLLHELEHLRNRHPMQHFLQSVCSTLFWFHPAVWLAARDAELTREFLCDEVVATTVGKYGSYLRTLARIAEHCRNLPCSCVVQGTLAFGNRKSALVRRSERLVRLAENRMAPKCCQPMLAVGALLALTLLVQQFWLPTNVLASGLSDWSPWPSWSAKTLHHFDISVRDFELFDNRVQIHDLFREDD